MTTLAVLEMIVNDSILSFTKGQETVNCVCGS